MEKSFGERLRHFRKLKGWSQGELAQKSGLSQTYISDLELDNREPSLSTMRRLGEVFGIPIDMFVSDLYMPTQDLPLPEELQKFLREQKRLPYVTLIQRAAEADISPEEIEAVIDAIAAARKRRNV